MNNEMNNNNLNNPENPSGISFVQGGTPVGTAPASPTDNVQPTMPTYTVPTPAPVAPTPVAPETPNMGVPTPQPVSPQPLEQPQPSFVSTPIQQVTSEPVPMPAPEVVNTMPNSAPLPQQPVAAPVQPQQVGMPGPNMGPMPGPIMPGAVPPAPMPNANNTGTNPEGEKQKTPIVMIIITALVVIGVIVFLVLYLTGKINFGSNKNNGESTIETPQNEVVLADWMNYLLDQEITEIKINRYIETDNSKSTNISKDELKSLFTKMKDYTLTKYYSISQIISNDDLQITYSKDGNTYDFVLSGENISIGDDPGLVAFFESDSINVEDDGQTSRDSEDYKYILKNFDNKIYDEYFTETE